MPQSTHALALKFILWVFYLLHKVSIYSYSLIHYGVYIYFTITYYQLLCNTFSLYILKIFYFFCSLLTTKYACLGLRCINLFVNTSIHFFITRLHFISYLYKCDTFSVKLNILFVAFSTFCMVSRSSVIEMK